MNVSAIRPVMLIYVSFSFQKSRSDPPPPSPKRSCVPGPAPDALPPEGAPTEDAPPTPPVAPAPEALGTGIVIVTGDKHRKKSRYCSTLRASNCTSYTRKVGACGDVEYRFWGSVICTFSACKLSANSNALRFTSYIESNKHRKRAVWALMPFESEAQINNTYIPVPQCQIMRHQILITYATTKSVRLTLYHRSIAGKQGEKKTAPASRNSCEEMNEVFCEK